MKELREGVSTGSCMTGGAEASVIWQTTGKCPSVVKVETPIGKTLYLDIIPKEFGVCGVVKRCRRRSGCNKRKRDYYKGGAF